MTTAEARAAPKPNWVRRIIFVLLGIVALIVTYFILASFVPRWWAQRAAALSDSSFARGSAWGLFFGIVCTLVPLLLVLLAVLIFQRRRSRMWIAGIALIAALLVALPNLMTLSVVLGSNSAAHAGERVMDVDAPGFRAATLWGAIIGALVFTLIGFWVFKYRRRGKQLAKARAEDLPPVTPPESTA